MSRRCRSGVRTVAVSSPHMTSRTISKKIKQHRDELEEHADSDLHTAYIAEALLDIADEEGEP